MDECIQNESNGLLTDIVDGAYRALDWIYGTVLRSTYTPAFFSGVFTAAHAIEFGRGNYWSSGAYLVLAASSAASAYLDSHPEEPSENPCEGRPHELNRGLLTKIVDGLSNIAYTHIPTFFSGVFTAAHAIEFGRGNYWSSGAYLVLAASSAASAYLNSRQEEPSENPDGAS